MPDNVWNTSLRGWRRFFLRDNTSNFRSIQKEFNRPVCNTSGAFFLGRAPCNCGRVPFYIWLSTFFLDSRGQWTCFGQFFVTAQNGIATSSIKFNRVDYWRKKNRYLWRRMNILLGKIRSMKWSSYYQFRITVKLFQIKNVIKVFFF